MSESFLSLSPPGVFCFLGKKTGSSWVSQTTRKKSICHIIFNIYNFLEFGFAWDFVIHNERTPPGKF